ncbi:MAG: hypothetical protein LBU09_00110, partial [Endomicrobium sp.]|nr:hypothetical protein [Endomicrobium sp.]
MKKIFLALLAAFLLFGQASGFQKLSAQDAKPSPNRVVIIERIPRIIVSPDRQPITLSDLKIDVEITGNLALTTYDMTFFNPNHTVMEGEFIMPLGENQSVSAIALDINGTLRDGVVVEKQKARQTFEAIVARGVDPGLVEKTAGNQFNTRIYPFNPSNTRRIKITIEEPLQTKNNAYLYNLPLTFNQTVNFSFNARFQGLAAAPKINGDLNFTKNVSPNISNLSFSQENYLLNNNVGFEIPKPAKEQIFTHKEGDRTFFYCDVNVSATSKNKTLPKKIAIFWDCSLSGAKRNIEKEKQLLGDYLRELSNVEITFISFNLKALPPKFFSIKNGNWAVLEKEIDEIKYDGATDISVFDKISHTDEILLFSDGINTFSNSSLSVPNKPVYSINSSPEFNRAALLSIARQSGGSFINLTSLDSQAALNKLLKQPLKLISYSYEKNKVKEIFPPEGTEVGENLTFAGILTASSADIEISFGYNKKEIVSSKKITINASGNNPAVARLWAQAKIRELELDPDTNEEEITKLAKEYSLVTDFTSLLVLETVRDYVTYKITPPQELREEYNRLLTQYKNNEEISQKNNIADAISQANQIKEWWGKNYDQSKPPRPFKKLKNSDEEMEETMSKEFALTSPSPTMAAPLDIERTASRDSLAASNNAPADSKLSAAASVRVKAWDPKTPYMKILKTSTSGELYKDYLKLKNGYEDQPSFYFDVADEFIRRNLNFEAVLILSNIAEMRLDNPELLRTAANKLMEIGQYGYAIELFTKILKLRGEDPQSYRDLALAYQADKQYQKALEYFYKVLSGSWGRFNSIKQIVFVEMNNLISLSPKLELSGIDENLIFEMPLDLRIVLGWSTNNTDMDIHVRDPYG